MREITYLEAIKEALDEEMARDPSVFVLGEDVGVYGGAFRVTEGFYEKYGEWRILDTPLSESGFTGAAIGAALVGMRPVVEMQFADFISCAFDQLVNVAAKNHYRWGGGYAHRCTGAVRWEYTRRGIPLPVYRRDSF